MSVQVTTAFVEQYKANVYHLVQQKGSKLRKAVRNESITGRSAYFEQIGATAARKRTSRHSDTPRVDTPHSRRRVPIADYDWADLIDQEDRVRMLIDPTSPYAEAAMYAMGRAIDDAILEAVDAVAQTGVDGSTATPYDTNNTIVANAVWPGITPASSGMNMAKLIEARKTLGENDVDPDDEMYVALNPRQVASLLQDERVISGDYNAALPLVQGKVSRVGGATLIPTTRITQGGSSNDQCPYWTKSGLLLAIGKDMTTKITERNDKNHATQVFCCMTIGATRMEEARVGIIQCDTNASPTGA